VLAVTEFTESLVPEAAAFRIFQDMRGVQATYRITAATTTELAQDLSAVSDVIHVVNANACPQPNLPEGLFGVVTIGAERIMYRERDVGNNTLRGLRRGTSGTAAADHAAGTAVYDLSRGNLLSEQYQNYVVSDTSVGDGSTTVFYAPSIDISDFGDSSTIFVDALEVYVGGQRQYPASVTESQYPWAVTDFDPVAVEFLTDADPINPTLLPPAGLEVTILVRRGQSWYEPGVDSASNGVALQDTNTEAARFLRGE
jgi:hypothetical protein